MLLFDVYGEELQATSTLHLWVGLGGVHVDEHVLFACYSVFVQEILRLQVDMADGDNQNLRS